jgi:hypothetical protein
MGDRYRYIQRAEPGAFNPTNSDQRMNHPWRILLASISVLAVTTTAALAQKTYAVGFGGGVAIPVGKLTDAQKTGFNALATLAIGVAELPVGVRFDAVFANLPKNKGLTTPQSGGASTVNSDLRVTGGLANLVFAFPGTNAKAYMLAGIGFYNSKLDIAGAKSQNNFGFNGGFGATFGSGPFAMFVEARYHSVSRSASNGGVYQFVPITLGLLF